MSAIGFDFTELEEIVVLTTIDVKYKVFQSKDLYKYSLFESFTDFISLDFEKLVDEIIQIVDKYEENLGYTDDELFSNYPDGYISNYSGLFESIVTFLGHKHIYFLCNWVISCLENAPFGEFVYNVFDDLINLQRYVNELQKNNNLYNMILFQKYLNLVEINQPTIYEIDKDKFYASTKNDEFLKIQSFLKHSEKYELNQNVTINELIDFFFTIEAKEEILSNYLFSYKFETPIDVCVASLKEIIHHRYLLKKCANCGKYFVPLLRSDAKYCDRISPQDLSKSCKEYGSYRQTQENLVKNEAAGLYRKIYMQKQMLAKRNADIEVYKTDFEEYKIKSKLWKNDIKKGLKTEDEFLTWLKSIRRKGDD